MFHYNVFVLFLQCICIRLQPIVLLDLIKEMYTTKIQINIGNPPIQKKLVLDLTIQKNILLNILDENTISIDNNNSVIVNEIEDYFSLYNISTIQKGLLNFNLMTGMKYYFELKESLAFPSNYINEKHSIIHYFKQIGLINKLSFSILYDIGLGQLFLGGIPDNRIINRKHSYCTIIGKNNYWDCLMISIELHNSTKHSVINNAFSPQYIYFDTVKEFIQVPSEFFASFFNFYNDVIKNANCNLKGAINSRKLFCEGIPFTQNETLSFVINNYNYTIELYSLFECNANNYCILMLEEKDKWIFGTFFLKLYHILFDYDNQKIHFYSERGVDYISSSNISVTQSLFMIVMILNIVAIVWIKIIKDVKM